MSLNAVFVAISVICFIAAATGMVAATSPLSLIAVGLAFFAASALVVRQ